MHALQLALGHHDAILHNRARAEAFEQLRAFQQPIECITSKIAIGGGDDPRVSEEKRITSHNDPGRATLSNHSLYCAFFYGHHEGKTLRRSRASPGIRAGKSQFLDVRSVSGLRSGFLFAYRTRPDDEETGIQEWVYERLLWVEIGYEHVLSARTDLTIRVLNNIISNFHTPFLDDFIQTGFLAAGFAADRASIE